MFWSDVTEEAIFSAHIDEGQVFADPFFPIKLEVFFFFTQVGCCCVDIGHFAWNSTDDQQNCQFSETLSMF